MIQEFSSALAVLLICSLLCSGQELFLNPDLEDGVNDWLHNGFTLQAEASEVYEGSASVKCIGRSQYYQGPGQNVPVERKKRYLFSSYVKLINDQQEGYGQPVGATMAIDWSDDGSTEYIPVASRRFVQPSDGWVMIEGDFIIADRPFTRAYLHIQGPDPGIDFYFDSASLTEIPENINWEAEANQRIESLRKSNVNFQFNVGSNFDASDIKVQIDHKRHLFGFGSLVNVANMIDSDMYQYQDIVYYLFNWATVQDYKWLFNKGNRTYPDYRDAVKVTDWLLNHGLKVRGHCMFWAVPGHEPGWVSPLKGQDLETAVDEHIAYMTNISMGKLSHWDVNNELLHGEFYEQGTDNPDYSYHMFRQVHKADPVPTLFLNDYSVVRDGSYTRAFLDQIEKFKAADVSLGGVGVQSHFQNGVTPDPTLLKRRLDLLAQPGIPMWATELDIVNDDEAERADWLEIIFRMFFSHPAMEGIILWNFWDHDMDVNKALLHGYFFVPGDAGQRYLDLVKGEWSTHVNQSLASGTSFDQRVFQGDYDLTVWYQGRPIQRTSFSVGKEDSTVTLDIDGDGQEIELPVEKDPFAKANQDKPETSYEEWRLWA